jgi:hypothetical protein
MNHTKQLSDSFVTAPQTQTTSAPSQRPTPLKPASVRTPHAAGQRGGTPIAPATFGTPAAPKVMQPKMHDSRPAAHNSRPAAASSASSGVVQANVMGGNHALQARLAQGARGQNGAQAIQRKTGAGVEAFKVPLREKTGGLPLPDAVRAKMETAFGTDFSDVRVHIGREASSLGAIAFTWGTNIHFAPGQYNPHTLQGQKLLGHELWHVVQQKNGRVKNPFGGGVAVVQDHALEAEADRMGIKAALTQVTRKKD